MDEMKDRIPDYPFEVGSSMESLKEKLEQFISSNSFSEKQKILNELAERLKTPEEVECVVMMICHIYLWTTSKHPIKKTCARILSSLDPELVKDKLSIQIKHFIAKLDRLEEDVDEDDNDMLDFETEKRRNTFLIILQGLFGTFPPGVEALNKIIDIVFLFAYDVFLSIFSFFESGTVPLELAQQLMYSTVKFLDTLLHNCDTSIHLSKESQTLLVKCYKAIRNEKLAFNTKAHCGALLVMAVVQFPDNIEQEELNNLASSLNIPSIKPEDNLLTVMLQSCEDCYTTRICIFSGIVHTCPLHVMSKYMVDETPVAIYIFKKMLEIAMVRTSIAPEILEISRTLISLSPLISKIKIEHLTDIIQGCWDYISVHWDHFVDAVRSDAQKLLKTVITLTLDSNDSDNIAHSVEAQPAAFNEYQQMFASAISEIIHGQNPNYKALPHIASTIKVQILMKSFPNLPQSLLNALDNPSVAQDVCVAYERLMEQHKKEMGESWIHVWVEPLLPFKHPEAVLVYILKIFNSAFKLNPSVLLLMDRETFTDAEYRAVLSCIIKARKTNVKLENILNVLTSKSCNGANILSKKHIQMLTCHQSAEIRILVLTLLVECQKSTEMFLPEDFKLLMIFFRFHASSSLPNFRQNMLALYKKAFNRFKDSFYVIQRSIRNEEARGENADADKLTPLKENENQYKDFIVTFFHQQLIRGLFNQVDFGKRAMCLELLLHLKTCLSEELYKAQWYPDYMYMLFAAFNDTYESNLVMLKNLLLGLPPEIVFRKDLEPVFIKPFTQVGFDVKSNVTTSATYAILVHIRSPNALEIIKKAYNIEGEETDECPALLVYRQLSKQISNELRTVRKDVNMAAKYAPVYGILFVMRHLIREEELDTQHPEILPKLVTQCLTIVEMALPVVNSAAPEGYNPSNEDYERADVTPQLVLHYAWRTIKEVSLLFGELRINSPNIKDILVKENILLKMTKYFMNLFEFAKHRGAYEQGYVGFSKFTEKLWNSKCRWCEFPERWLEKAMELITSNSSKLCATRRSAGFPFLIQSILVTEPKRRANESFHYCMQYLLKVAENYAEDNQTSSLHSMNILRALYRHNQLGEVVASYVSKGVMISITRFSHSEWAIRNSATLMFGALIMRIFGVQRLKDYEDVSIKNRLPFKVFKSRYPDLYKFLFEKLEEYVADGKENVSMYPVLVILGRLYLTFDSKQDDKLAQHLETLIKATTRTIYKIRELAVSATVTFESFLNRNIRADKTTNNEIHAYLLRLKYHVRTPNIFVNKLSLSYFKPLLILISDAGRGISQTCSTTLMDILIEFLKTYEYKDEDLETYKELLGHLHYKVETTISTCCRFQQTKFTLYLHVIMKIPQGQWYSRTFIAKALLQALSSRNEDLNIFALNCIRYISTDKIQEPESKELEYEFVKSLSPQTKSLLNCIIRVHLIKRRTFMDLFDILRSRSRLYGLKVCQVLYNYPSIVCTIRPLAVPVRLSHQIILDYLDRQATCINSEMFVAIMGLISKFVAGSNEILDLGDLIEHMIEYGGDDSTMEERLAIANFLLNNTNLLVNTDGLPEDLRLKLWQLYLDLIQDDEFVVRDFCTQITHRVLSAVNSKEVNECYKKKFPVTPERLHVDMLAKLPYFLGINEALKVYVSLCLQFDEAYEYTDEKTIYDKQRPHNFKESRQFAPLAKNYLTAYLWKLEEGLSYEDKSIFIEEHFLLVVTRLVNFIINQDDTEDRSLCVAVLTRFARYLERVKVGTVTAEQILDNFVIAFKAAEAGERELNKTMCACVTEVSQFLSFVLFSRHVNPIRRDLDECKCDNL